jgi:hypothetical protein
VSSREVDGEAITLSASGWTYNNRFVLYDYETESLWYCLEGDCRFTCVSGVHADKQLIALPSEITTWDDWHSRNPGTGILQFPLLPPDQKDEPLSPEIRR